MLYAQFGFFYDIINNRPTLLSYVQMQNGVFNSQNSLPIFEIIKHPEWNENEKYDFNWEELKSEKDKFVKLEI